MNYSSIKARAEREWYLLENLPQPLLLIGMGTCGRASGAQDILDAAKHALRRMNILGRIIETGCVGMCYAEPIMAVRKPGRPFIYYGNLTTARTEEILSTYLLDNDPKPRWALCTLGEETIDGIPHFSELPMIRPQVRIALRNCGLIDPGNIDHYIARGGYSGLHRAL